MQRLDSTETYPGTPLSLLDVDEDEQDEFDFEDKNSDFVKNKTGFQAKEQYYRHLTHMDIRDRVIGDGGIARYTRHRSRRSNLSDFYQNNMRHPRGFYGRLIFAVGLLAFTQLCASYIKYKKSYLLHAPFFNDAVELLNPIKLPEPISDIPVRILYWTKKYGKKPKEGTMFCPSKCQITVDKRKLNKSDAVLFHMWDLKNKKGLPTTRFSRKQKWVMMNLEPTQTVMNHMRKFNGVFNVTMTYRQDSDIYVPYGYLKKLDKYFNIKIEHSIRKSKLAAWFVNSCNTQSKREDYMSELREHMEVDIFGNCGKYRCDVKNPKGPDDVKKCFDMFNEQYKFFFVMENSLCQDYVTEKVWDMLRFNVVPIVLGNTNFKNILPENSYIDVRNFSSPRELAAYVKLVGNNTEMYNSYFNWQRSYEVVLVKEEERMCLLCDYLHATRRDQELKEHLNIGEWWGKKCMNVSTFYRGNAPIAQYDYV